jgi:phosphomethylpyrimidine synthase
MNKPTRSSELELPKVTTGPLPASRKVYSAPEGFPDVEVPLREIALSEKSNEPPVRVYDYSGPYPEDKATIDVARGLPRGREAWVKARAVEAYDGRNVKPEDNGNVTGTRVARDFPNKPKPFRGLAPSLAAYAAHAASASPQRGEAKGATSLTSPRRGEVGRE